MNDYPDLQDPCVVLAELLCCELNEAIERAMELVGPQHPTLSEAAARLVFDIDPTTHASLYSDDYRRHV
jgi:hypothetical protein